MTKKSERARVLKERNALSSAKYAELNRALCGFVSRFLESAEVKTIGAFLPIGSEPNISEVLEKWLRVDTNRRVFLPVTEGKTMRFAYWDPEKPLKIGRFDVPEPTSELFSEPPLLLIPCVALNKEGYRLGYGAGYYDRYLSACAEKPFTAGICFSEFCDLDFAAEPFDAKLDAVISDSGFRRP